MRKRTTSQGHECLLTTSVYMPRAASKIKLIQYMTIQMNYLGSSLQQEQKQLQLIMRKVATEHTKYYLHLHG